MHLGQSAVGLHLTELWYGMDKGSGILLPSPRSFALTLHEKPARRLSVLLDDGVGVIVHSSSRSDDDVTVDDRSANGRTDDDRLVEAGSGPEFG